MNNQPKQDNGAVAKHIGQPIPATLWHYTSFNALLGIITSRKIWATEYRFLNDREEFQHAKKLANELVEEEPEITGKNFSARDMLRKAIAAAFNTGSLHEERLRIMVASFSEVGDQLSQWRGYANGSMGVSLGLDLRNLRPPSEIGTAVTFAPCLYKEDEKRSLLKMVLARFREGLEDWWNSAVGSTPQKLSELQRSDPEAVWKIVTAGSTELRAVIYDCMRNLQFDLLRIAPLLKDEGFSEEKEWRLVLPVEARKMPTQHPIEFRASANTLIPYIAFPLVKANEDFPAPCTDIILGPGSHASAQLAVNMFMKKEAINVLARPSRIPFRL